MAITVKRLPKSKVIITAKPTKKDIELATMEALRKISQELDIPGFRKGRAPLEMVHQRINDAKLALEAMDILVNNLFLKAIKEHQLWPLGRPKVNLPNQEKVYQELISKKEGTLSAAIEYELEIKPEIKIKKEEYQNIAVQRSSTMVKESEVEEAVQNLFSEWKRKKERDEDKEKIATATSLSEAEQKAHEKKKEDQQAAAKATKAAPDDEWAQMIGEADLSSLRSKVQSLLMDIKRGQADQEMEQQIFNYLLALVPDLELPETLIQDQLDSEEEHLRKQLQASGTTVENFLKERKKSLEEVKAKWQEIIERRLRIDFILDHIAGQENITAEDSAAEHEIEQIRDPETRKKFENREQKAYIKYMLRQKKTIEWLKKRVGKGG